MGRVQASTVNGSIEANDLGGEVEASTTNGSVEVEMARVDPSGRNRLSTTNGSVRLVLPRDVGADVEAHTVNGAARCEFDLAADTRVSRRSIEGRIGSGGARFELRTVNGSTHIERGLATAAGYGQPAPGRSDAGRRGPLADLHRIEAPGEKSDATPASGAFPVLVFGQHPFPVGE